MASDPRQSSLPGVQFETPVQSQHEPQPGKIGTIRRDPRLREVALRVDEYERARYIQHPRCTRPKRDTPQARDISVEAITRAIERCLPQFETLEQLETRFRAVVELNWEAADRKSETWDWWTGSALWQPNSLDRVLGWLEEKRNWIYLDRAAGKTPLPQRAGDTGNLDHDLLDLSPAEQQAEYNKRHGIDPGSMTISIGGQELHGISDGQFVEITDDEPEPGQWKRWADIPPIKLEIMPLVEGEPSEVVSYPSVAGIQMPAPDPISPELFDGLRLPPPPTDEELRASSQRKLEYMRSTTPEQRAEDAQAGRKPWEVN